MHRINSNLPPGLSDNMLPGNTSDDIAFETFIDWLSDFMSDKKITIEECQKVLISYKKQMEMQEDTYVR